MAEATTTTVLAGWQHQQTTVNNCGRNITTIVGNMNSSSSNEQQLGIAAVEQSGKRISSNNKNVSKCIHTFKQQSTTGWVPAANGNQQLCQRQMQQQQCSSISPIGASSLLGTTPLASSHAFIRGLLLEIIDKVFELVEIKYKT